MELLLQMSEYLKMQIMNCLIQNPILIGHVFIKVLSMKQVHHLLKFSLKLLDFAFLVNQCVVREDDKQWYDSRIMRNSRKRDRLKKSALKSGYQND